MYWGLNTGYWRYTSTRDVQVLVRAHLATTLMLATAIAILRIESFPRSVLFLEFVISLMLAFGVRMGARMLADHLRGRGALSEGSDVREVLIVGAGDSGHALVKMLIGERRLGYHPIGILDDSENLQGVNVFGVPVLGRTAILSEVLERSPAVSAVVVAIPSLSKSRFDEIAEVCQEHSVLVKRMQAFEDIACIDASDAEPELRIEALLDRDTSVSHDEEVREALSGRRVLITGAGGSIGAELVQQVLGFGPSLLIMVDSCEYNLFRIDLELRRRGETSRVKSVLLNVCDNARLAEVFSEYKPEYVFHAAAYKHVPLLEENCTQAFINNVVGTRNLLDQCLAAGTRRFILISTDKAVNPTSVMGASKRVAEMLTLEACVSASKLGVKEFSAAAVRFGNVINSNGSVIPLFKEQIASGGPITVTHPEMERYFMSIREAVRLVLIAGTLTQSGEVYVLDMGRPVRILDVAKKMRALYGRRDVPIVFTGIRPGEKLSERLSEAGENTTSTRFQKVMRIVSSAPATEGVFAWTSRMEAQLGNLESGEIGQRLLELTRLDASTDGIVAGQGSVAKAQ
jgi:FlaA1/EpsC-like NDP-sugar epimerase